MESFCLSVHHCVYAIRFSSFPEILYSQCSALVHSAPPRSPALFSQRCTIGRRWSFIPISLVPPSTLSRFLLIDLTLYSLKLIPKAKHWVRLSTVAAFCEQSDCTLRTLNPLRPPEETLKWMDLFLDSAGAQALQMWQW